MEKEFIPYEQALTLKELGFDEPCLRGWYLDESLYYHPDSDIVLDNPTFSQAFRWFREKYGYDVTIKKCTPSEYKFEIEQLFVEGNNYYFIDFFFDTYEEAEVACLRKLIEIVKRK
jgi:hypothetical protein